MQGTSVVHKYHSFNAPQIYAVTVAKRNNPNWKRMFIEKHLHFILQKDDGANGHDY